MCKGCAVVNEVRCCYNCINCVIRREEGLCREFGAMGKLDDRIFQYTNCSGFKRLELKQYLEAKVSFNYCPECGMEKEESFDE